MKGILRFTIGGAALATLLCGSIGCIDAHPPYRAHIPARNVSRATQPPAPAAPATEEERRYAVAP